MSLQGIFIQILRYLGNLQFLWKLLTEVPIPSLKSWVAGNEVIVNCYYRKRGQPSFCRETELGHYRLESMDRTEAGKQRKAKKGRRNQDKDTGTFASTFLTIASFPATHAETEHASHCFDDLKWL